MRKKLLLVSNMVYHYRVPVYNYLNERLGAIGYTLVVLTDRVQDNNPNPAEFELIEEPFNYRKYKSLIRQAAPDVVMLFMHIRDFVVWPLQLWLKRIGTPMIYWNHGINLETPDNALKKIIYGIFHSAADAIVLYSPNEKKYIAPKHQAKIFVANNTINFREIPAINESVDELKRKWRVKFEKVALFVGRVTASKRLDDLIEAAKFLEPGTGVIVVGGGLTQAQLETIRKAPNIIYLGEIYDALEINQIFKMSDIFCIPGKNGLGINQAFFWGLPLVTENVLHSPEIAYVEDGRNGLIVDKGDTEALARSINKLLQSESLYESFSKAARDEIIHSADIDVMCDGFLEAVRYVEYGCNIHEST